MIGPAAEADQVDAKYTNGVLTVTIPKAAEARTRRIALYRQGKLLGHYWCVRCSVRMHPCTEHVWGMVSGHTGMER
jgi:hypothetical protein